MLPHDHDTAELRGSNLLSVVPELLKSFAHHGNDHIQEQEHRQDHEQVGKDNPRMRMGPAHYALHISFNAWWGRDAGVLFTLLTILECSPALARRQG